MSEHGPDPPERTVFPKNWDVLAEPPEPEGEQPGRMSRRVLLAATAWADLAVILALCAAALATCRRLGFPVSLTAVPWAVAMALAVWLGVTVVLLRIRRSWPGALLIGAGRIEPDGGLPLALTVLLTIAGFVSLGIVPALLAGRPPWSSLSPLQD